jgi:branched-chain amino acid transport system substrate-binding protein
MQMVAGARSAAGLALVGALALAHPSAAEEKGPIRIAVLDALGGAYASYGMPTVYGAHYVFDKVNAEGGLFGRKIEVVTEDDGCSPKTAVGGATKLAADPSIVAVLGLTCSGAAGAVRDSVAANAPFPFLTFSAGGWTSTSPKLGGLNPNFFYISTPIHTQAGGLVNFVMNTLKPSRIAFIGQTDVYGKEGLQGVTDMLDQYGQKLVASETVEARTADVTPQVLKLREVNPDVVISFAYEIPVQTFLRQANELGFKPTIITSGSIVNMSLYNSLPPEALAKYFGSSVVKDSFSSAAMKPILDVIRANEHGAELNWLSLLTTAGAETLLEAMKKAGPDLNGEKVRAALENIRNFETSTLVYPVSFFPENHTAGQGERIYKIENGTEENVMAGYWPGVTKATAPVTQH